MSTPETLSHGPEFLRRAFKDSCTAGKRTERNNVLFPEPETPVITVNRPIGNRTSIAFRLFARAPFNEIQFASVNGRRGRAGCTIGFAGYPAGHRGGVFPVSLR